MRSMHRTRARLQRGRRIAGRPAGVLGAPRRTSRICRKNLTAQTTSVPLCGGAAHKPPMLGAMPAHVEPEPVPRFVEPMLATPADFAPEGSDWVLELKWDGCRGQL